MHDFLKIFLNSRSLNAATKTLSLSQMEDVANKLAIIINKRKEEDERLQQAKIAEQEKIQQYMAMLEQDGISPEMLLDSLGDSQKSKRPKKEAVYQYEDAGILKTWTGQGRKPSVIETALQNGASLDDFKIKKD